MKKINYIVLFIGVTLLLVSPLSTQEKTTQEISAGETGEKDPGRFLKVEKPAAVPGEIKTGFDTIRAKDCRILLDYLASDVMEGRETGENGYRAAAEFAATMLKLWRIEPGGDIIRKKERSFFQEVPIKEILKTKSEITLQFRDGGMTGKKIFSPEFHYRYRVKESGSFSGPVVFAGYGITERGLKYDDLRNLDIKGKIVMYLSGLPGGNDKKSPFNQPAIKKKYRSRQPKNWKGLKIDNLEKNGARAIIVIESAQSKPGFLKRRLAHKRIDDERRIYPGEYREMALAEPRAPVPWDTVPIILVSRNMARTILKKGGQDLDKRQARIDKLIKPSSCALPGVTLTLEGTVEDKLLGCRSVIGFIEGSDPELKKEAVVIGAHLDHEGKRGDYIFNGAHDNGSGSVGVMMLARAMAINPVKPKRSIVFCLWTGEEKAYLGSYYYTAHPLFPLEKTAAYLNMDMIGRKYTKETIKTEFQFRNMPVPRVLKDHEGENFMPVIYSQKNQENFNSIFENANQHVGFDLYIHPMTVFMSGSDHIPFMASGVPWASFHAATTEHYHESSDATDKIEPEMMEKIVKLLYISIFSL